MEIYIYCYALVLLLFSTTEASVKLVFDDGIHPCENGLPLPKVDISGVEIIPQDEGTIAINGMAKYLDDYESPTMWKMTTKRLERGQWVDAIISREVLNLCPIIAAPNEFWYAFTKYLKKKDCPFKKGYEEHFDMVDIGNGGEQFDIPPEFIGEWKVYHQITTTRRGFPAKECFMSPLSIMEV